MDTSTLIEIGGSVGIVSNLEKDFFRGTSNPTVSTDEDLLFVKQAIEWDIIPNYSSTWSRDGWIYFDWEFPQDYILLVIVGKNECFFASRDYDSEENLTTKEGIFFIKKIFAEKRDYINASSSAC